MRHEREGQVQYRKVVWAGIVVGCYCHRSNIMERRGPVYFRLWPQLQVSWKFWRATHRQWQPHILCSFTSMSTSQRLLVKNTCMTTCCLRWFTYVIAFTLLSTSSRYYATRSYMISASGQRKLREVPALSLSKVTWNSSAVMPFGFSVDLRKICRGRTWLCLAHSCGIVLPISSSWSY